LREADAAYQQLIAIAPTAPNHFLLARFYESAERSATAIAHARQAATLDPTNYGAPAVDLIRKVSQGGFGCLAGLKYRAMPDISNVSAPALSRPLVAGVKP
jgi:tetratricopeptide (TPR) repeat protein